jgi:hypothetical protein
MENTNFFLSPNRVNCALMIDLLLQTETEFEQPEVYSNSQRIPMARSQFTHSLRLYQAFFHLNKNIFHLHRINIWNLLICTHQELVFMPLMRAAPRSLCSSFTSIVSSPDSWWTLVHWLAYFCIWRTTNLLCQIHARHRPINLWSTNKCMWNGLDWMDDYYPIKMIYFSIEYLLTHLYWFLIHSQFLWLSRTIKFLLSLF